MWRLTYVTTTGRIHVYFNGRHVRNYANWPEVLIPFKLFNSAKISVNWL